MWCFHFQQIFSVFLLLFCVLSSFIASIISRSNFFPSSFVFSRSSIIPSYRLVMNPLICLFVLSFVSHVISTFNDSFYLLCLMLFQLLMIRFVDSLMRLGTTVHRFYLLRSPKYQFHLCCYRNDSCLFDVFRSNTLLNSFIKTKITIGWFPVSLN